MSQSVILVTLNCHDPDQSDAFEVVKNLLPALRDNLPRQGHIVLAAFPSPEESPMARAASKRATKAKRGRKR